MLSFRDAVLLFPLALAVHVFEEWPGSIGIPALALGLAAAFHALEVGHNLFERW